MQARTFALVSNAVAVDADVDVVAVSRRCRKETAWKKATTAKAFGICVIPTGMLSHINSSLL